MKLIIILSNRAYESDIKNILKESGVKVFSSERIEGFHFDGGNDLGSNWFGTGKHSQDSVLLFAFCMEATLEKVFTSIRDFNKNENTSKVHAFRLNVEDMV